MIRDADLSRSHPLADTFAELGLTPRILEGAADMYRLIDSTRLSARTSRDETSTLDQVLDATLEAAG